MHGESDDGALVGAAERICVRIADVLSRWFGAYGSRALIARALTRAKADHPQLAAMNVAPAPGECLTGLAESARTHGARATAEGIVGLLAALAGAIGRLIGDDLTVNVLEHGAAGPAPSVLPLSAGPSGYNAATDAAAAADVHPPVYVGRSPPSSRRTWRAFNVFRRTC